MVKLVAFRLFGVIVYCFSPSYFLAMQDCSPSVLPSTPRNWPDRSSQASQTAIARELAISVLRSGQFYRERQKISSRMQQISGSNLFLYSTSEDVREDLRLRSFSF